MGRPKGCPPGVIPTPSLGDRGVRGHRLRPRDTGLVTWGAGLASSAASELVPDGGSRRMDP